MSEILQSLSSAIGRIRVKSVVDNFIRFILILVAFIIVAAFLNIEKWLLVFLIVMLALSVITMLFVFIYFSIKNPDYLRSEDYHLRKQSMEILGDKENYLPIDAKEIRGIANPYTETTANLKEECDE